MLAAAAAALTAACGGNEETGGSSDVAPTSMSMRVAVGPIPGPNKTVPELRNPYAGDRHVMREGRVLFVAFNCSGCHGGRAGGGMGPSLRDEVWAYGDSDGQIFDSIAAGRANGMPAWGTMLPESEIWKLVTYISSLRTPDEPDAPRPRRVSDGGE